eukprot:gene9664-biopygen6759
MQPGCSWDAAVCSRDAVGMQRFAAGMQPGCSWGAAVCSRDAAVCSRDAAGMQRDAAGKHREGIWTRITFVIRFPATINPMTNIPDVAPGPRRGKSTRKANSWPPTENLRWGPCPDCNRTAVAEGGGSLLRCGAAESS